MSKQESHKQALRQVVEHFVGDMRGPLFKEQFVDEILRVSERFNGNPSLDAKNEPRRGPQEYPLSTQLWLAGWAGRAGTPEALGETVMRAIGALNGAQPLDEGERRQLEDYVVAHDRVEDRLGEDPDVRTASVAISALLTSLR